MGSWKIEIRGTGAHHNGSPSDANVIAARMVEALTFLGHKVRAASFEVTVIDTTGGFAMERPTEDGKERIDEWADYLEKHLLKK